MAVGILPQADYTMVSACDSCSLFPLLMGSDRYDQGSYPSPLSEAHLVPPAGVSLLLVVLQWHCFIFQQGSTRAQEMKFLVPFPCA